MTDREMYRRAVRITMANGRPSLSLLMREFQVPYNTAARLMERMENNKVVSPVQPDGNRILLKKPKVAE